MEGLVQQTHGRGHRLDDSGQVAVALGQLVVGIFQLQLPRNGICGGHHHAQSVIVHMLRHAGQADHAADVSIGQKDRCAGASPVGMYLVVVLRPKDLEGDPVHQDRADPVGAQPGFAAAGPLDQPVLPGGPGDVLVPPGVEDIALLVTE